MKTYKIEYLLSCEKRTHVNSLVSRVFGERNDSKEQSMKILCFRMCDGTFVTFKVGD